MTKMAVTLETIHEDMQKMKQDLVFLRHVMEEEYELSTEARRELQAARARMARGDYIPHEKIMEKYG